MKAAEVEHDAGRQVAQVTISWQSYPNDDLPVEEHDGTPDEGWYIDIDLTDGMMVRLGPDFYGPGLKTFDEALALVKKWADGRGLKICTDTFFLPVFRAIGGEP